VADRSVGRRRWVRDRRRGCCSSFRGRSICRSARATTPMCHARVCGRRGRGEPRARRRSSPTTSTLGAKRSVGTERRSQSRCSSWAPAWQRLGRLADDGGLGSSVSRRRRQRSRRHQDPSPRSIPPSDQRPPPGWWWDGKAATRNTMPHSENNPAGAGSPVGVRSSLRRAPPHRPLPGRRRPHAPDPGRRTAPAPGVGL
jgi:hypothetical protein